MQRAGGIVSIIAGVFGVLAGGATILVGLTTDTTSAFSGTVLSGLAGIAFSFAVIVLGALGISTHQQQIGILLVLASIGGAFVGGTFVAIAMVLGLVGGILVIMSRRAARL